MRKILLALAISLTTLSVYAGDVTVLPGYCPFQGGCYVLSGTITKSDLNSLGTFLSKAAIANQQISVSLNSNGGDFHTAITLGRMMRRANAAAMGGQSDICMSSCVMLLAGATFRGHAGKVGIHRPYRMTNEPISQDAMRQEFNMWGKEAKDFLSEVNVPTNLWDSMIRIPPEEVKILTQSELRDFGLKGEDPVSAELNDSSSAKYYGLSKVEYLKHKGAADVRCSPILQSGRFEEWSSCEEKIKRTGNY